MDSVCQSDVVRSLQSGSFESPYLRREVENNNEASKGPCRQRVLDFILKHHDAGSLRLLSLPSMHWRFEHMLQDARLKITRAKNEFIGVERDADILRQSMPWMPGENPSYFDRGFTSLSFHGARTSQAWMIHMDLETFVRLGQRWALTSRERNAWHMYRFWTAIWLDFTSQLSQPLELALPKIGAGCDSELSTVPVAITFLKGREPEHIQNKILAAGSREDYVFRLLNSGRHRTFSLEENFEYTTGTGVLMMTVMGLMKLKQLEPPRDHLEENGIRIPSKARGATVAP